MKANLLLTGHATTLGFSATATMGAMVALLRLVRRLVWPLTRFSADRELEITRLLAAARCRGAAAVSPCSSGRKYFHPPDNITSNNVAHA